MQPWKPDQQQIQQQPILAQQQIQQQRIQQQQKESPLRGANYPTGLAEPPNLDREALVFAAARDALEKQQWAASVGGFTELLSSPRYAADARYGLGWIELQQGSMDRAGALFREATQYNERHANAWYALGRLAEARSMPEAIADYRRAVAAEPTHYGAAERLRLLGQAGERSEPRWAALCARTERRGGDPVEGRRPCYGPERRVTRSRPARRGGVSTSRQESSLPASAGPHQLP